MEDNVIAIIKMMKMKHRKVSDLSKATHNISFGLGAETFSLLIQQFHDIILLHPLDSCKSYESLIEWHLRFEKMVRRKVPLSLFFHFPHKLCANAPKRHSYFNLCDLTFLGLISVIYKIEIQCWKTDFISIGITCF